jgi:hypothetical protein
MADRNSPLGGRMASRQRSLAYMLDPRYGMAQQAMQQGTSTAPVQSWGEGLARMLQAGIGGYQAGQLRQEYQGKEAERAKTMAEALAAMGGRPGGVETTPGGTSINWNAVPGDFNAGIQKLASNPELTDLAATMQMNRMTAEQARADKMAEPGYGMKHIPGIGLVDLRSGTPSLAMPEEKAPMTLSPGGMLVGRDGKIIAKAPERETPVSLSPGGQLVNPKTGEVIASAPEKPERPMAVPAGGSIIDPKTGQPVYTALPKPLPASAIEHEAEDVTAIGSVSGINSDLNSFKKKISSGELDLGLFANLWNKGKNYVGASDTESRNLGSFMSTLERLRNESLRLNKGIQTEGDAVRAWNELITNVNDPKLVMQRIDEINDYNNRAMKIRKLAVDTRRTNFGSPGYDWSKLEGSSPPANPAPRSQEDAAALEWANANPKDPRSAEILRRLGGQ